MTAKDARDAARKAEADARRERRAAREEIPEDSSEAPETSADETGPPALVDLPAGRLACADCGVMAPEGAAEVLRVPVFHGQRSAGGGADVPTQWVPNHVVDLPLGRCPSCERRAVHPWALASGVGVGRDRTGRALSALAAAGAPLPSPGGREERYRADLLELLASAGTGVPWSRYAAGGAIVSRCREPDPFVPGYYRDGTALAGRCAAEPWAHVPADVRTELRRVAGRRMAARMAAAASGGAPAAPLDLSPPGGGGCGMCGLATQPFDAARAALLGGAEVARRSVWSPSSWAGSGPMCTACREDVERRGAWGPPVWESVYMAHLKREGRDHEAAMAGLCLGEGSMSVRPWSSSRRPPSARPWAHVPEAVPAAW